MTGTDATDWLRAEFDKPPTNYLPELQSLQQSGQDVEGWMHRAQFWDAMIEADDALRQRMVFALSQILVVSDRGVDGSLPMAFYMDALSENAFGNYRDLLQDVTYSPAMADFLTYLRNKKGDEDSGRTPDENFARELLQLFTIGLVELKMDGSPKLGADGKPIETFTNEDIVGLARVFTGMSLKGSEFWDADDDGWYAPLQSFDKYHSELEKSFLGTTISAGTDADASIEQALDHIFEHPNVAPFISRQLIQRFTASHPTPRYVERVATAFEAGQFQAGNGIRFGTGQRGDLEATLAAILLDPTLFDGQVAASEGKIREPVLRFVHWAKAFDIAHVNSANEGLLLWSSGADMLGQQPFRSPSVFNFYRPGYIAPGTSTGDRSLTAPEFQIVNDGAAVGYADFMSLFIRDHSWVQNNSVTSFTPNYSDEIALADTPEDLADHLNTLLLSERMTPQTRERMISVLNEIPIRDDAEKAAEDRLSRVHIAVTMAVTDPAFIIQF